MQITKKFILQKNNVRLYAGIQRGIRRLSAASLAGILLTGVSAFPVCGALPVVSGSEKTEQLKAPEGIYLEEEPEQDLFGDQIDCESYEVVEVSGEESASDTGAGVPDVGAGEVGKTDAGDIGDIGEEIEEKVDDASEEDTTVSGNEISEELSAEGATSYKFTKKSGKFYLNTVNTATGAKQSHTVTVTVNTTTNMSTGKQDAKFSVSSSGNWQKVRLADSKHVMGAISETGKKSKERFVIYNSLTCPKPLGYIISSASVASSYDANVDGYGIGASVRWFYQNSGVKFGTVGDGQYFNMSLMNKYAPPLQKNDTRFNNTYTTSGDVVLMFIANCKNVGLRLDSQSSGVKNMTITLNYTPASYTVTYQGEGGTTPANTAAVYDRAFTLPTPTRTGYTFKGWSGSGLSGKTGNVVNLTAANGAVINLKAGWSPNSYKVRYDSAGGNAISDTTASYDTPFILPTPQRTGYVFTGWTGAGLTNQTGSVKNLTATAGGTVSLKAGWRAVSYKVSFRSDSEDTFEDVNLAYGEELELPTPFKEDYTFLGWSGGGIVKRKGKVSNLTTMNDSVVELTAEWIRNEDLKDLPDDPEDDDPIQITNQYNQYVNEYGLSDQQAQAILAALAKGSMAQLTINGTDFSFVKNEDGSITIRIARVGEGGRVVIPAGVTIGDITYPITVIEKECFKNNTTIKEIVFGSNIQTVSDRAFMGCTSLTKVTPNEGLRSIGAKAFYKCTSLKEFHAPSSLQTIDKSAFEGCKSLKNLTLGDNLLSIGNRAFYGCSALKKLNIPKKLLKIGSSAFAACTGLQKITHAEGAELLKMGKSVFSGDKKLSKVTLPATVVEIPSKAFYGCAKLKKVTLPSKVQKIGNQAYYGCSNLKNVSIKSKTLTKVGTKAFKKCKKKILFSVPHGKTVKYAKLMKGKY